MLPCLDEEALGLGEDYLLVAAVVGSSQSSFVLAVVLVVVSVVLVFVVPVERREVLCPGLRATERCKCHPRRNLQDVFGLYRLPF